MGLEETDEKLITAWVKLTGILKNSRITQGLNYNEAIVMMLCYNKYRKDGEGLISFQEIVTETNMLKSLVNRTIQMLAEKSLVERCEGEDRRTVFIRPVKENLDVFLEVHGQSLLLANTVRTVIGDEDAEAFIRLVGKIAASKEFGANNNI